MNIIEPTTKIEVWSKFILETIVYIVMMCILPLIALFIPEEYVVIKYILCILDIPISIFIFVSVYFYGIDALKNQLSLAQSKNQKN